MQEPSVSYFPLRSNAYSLVAGAGVKSVTQRLKVASLLHDHVVVEDGVYDINAGPGGSAEFWRPSGAVGPHGYQTARERGKARRGGFSVTLKPTDAPEEAPAIAAVTSRDHLAWRPTFEPIKAELPAAIDWMEFTRLVPTDEAKNVIARRIRSDMDDTRLLPDEDDFVRRRILGAVNEDLIVGSGWAAVSMDSLHRQLVQARVRLGEAVPVLGHRALTVVVPGLAELSWSDIDELRQLAGITGYRQILSEVESAARTSGRPIDEEIGIELARRQVMAEEELRHGSWAARRAGVAVGLVVGAVELALGIPDPGMGGAVIGRLATKALGVHPVDHWLSFQARLAGTSTRS